MQEHSTSTAIPAGAIKAEALASMSASFERFNVSTRKFQRSMRLPEGDVPAPKGAGLSKSAASRHFVALSAARLKESMAADLSGLDLLVIQIDGIHMDEDMTLVAAVGVDKSIAVFARAVELAPRRRSAPRSADGGETLLLMGIECVIEARERLKALAQERRRFG